MNVHVFAGPTLAAAEVRAEIAGGAPSPSGPPWNVIVSGPASFGDVCRAAQARPIAILIIDGYFERVPAVWHKEILWAMSEGVHVFGSSSMGALRAAELAEFGMVGVGSIYEAFRGGVLEDDDEVAVVHGPTEDGYMPLSEAMVNIRATLDAATEAGVLGAGTAEVLRRIAKARFYGDRSYPAMFVEAESHGVDRRELQPLREWLPRGRVDQKRADARLLLHRVRDWLETTPKRKQVGYRFEPTDAWLEAQRVALEGFAGAGSSSAATDAIVEELRVAGVYATACAGAAARGAALEQARRAGVRPDRVAVRAAAEEFRRERGLFRQPAFDRWRVEQRLDEAQLARFFEDHALVEWARPMTEALAREHLVDHLRAVGEYGRHAARAEAKAARLAQLGSPAPSLGDVGITEQSLWSWYFEERLGTEIPESLEAFARSAGFGGKDEMRAAVLRELHYARHGSG